MGNYYLLTLSIIQRMEAPAISAMAVPDFLAGFVYGMVQDNQLVEIEGCAQGWEIMLPEIQTGINDIKAGGWNNDTQAALEFALVILQIPQALHACESMQDDIAAIESWAQIFTNPAQLAATVSKNMVFHKSAISSDMTALTTDWDAGEYVSAGEDLAQLMIDLIGPIETTELGISAMAIPDFLAGFIYGMTNDNQLEEIEACATGFEIMYPEIQTGIDDIKAGGWNYDVQAALQFALVILQIPQALNTCENMDDDFAAISEWAQIFTDPAKLAATVSKNLLFHKSAIKADLSALETDWDTGLYFESGEELA